ncbi:rhodanese domain-containing protein CG4456-like isoform X2 [Pogonomyrmex barbatus]|uniref:Rhodanese domain-containing protein CG4456-like isoform X2 n=1 Tax=Pogonomyrmex barbatus TaxID=144034 RepID=A0A8N1S6Z9_9HYME|nr:rhodanese domain-containing protein CG4456-like isoform X2 [Pogonomyrmex barbatus]
MYPRFSRRLYQKFVSSSFFRESRYITTTNCRRFLIVTSNYPNTDSLTRSLHSSNISHQKTDVPNLYENEMALNVDYEQLLEAQKDENVLIVDVREHDEINETGKLPGSIHIPKDDVSNVFLNLSEEEFENRYGKRKPTKDTKIIFSCRSGRRSAWVQETMQKLGYTKVYNYTGGWQDWESKQKKN